MKNHSVSHSASELPAAQAEAGRLAACGAVFLIGAALVFLVGFAHPAVLHNAAHDSRHALAFPCH